MLVTRLELLGEFQYVSKITQRDNEGKHRNSVRFESIAAIGEYYLIPLYSRCLGSKTLHRASFPMGSHFL